MLWMLPMTTTTTTITASHHLRVSRSTNCAKYTYIGRRLTRVPLPVPNIRALITLAYIRRSIRERVAGNYRFQHTNYLYTFTIYWIIFCDDLCAGLRNFLIPKRLTITFTLLTVAQHFCRLESKIISSLIHISI